MAGRTLRENRLASGQSISHQQASHCVCGMAQLAAREDRSDLRSLRRATGRAAQRVALAPVLARRARRKHLRARRQRRQGVKCSRTEKRSSPTYRRVRALPVTVKCVFEGWEEEIGSQSLDVVRSDATERYVRRRLRDGFGYAHLRRLERVLRSPTALSEEAWRVFEMEVRGPERDPHSGLYGGALSTIRCRRCAKHQLQESCTTLRGG